MVFATIETILFAWVFGIEKAWDEIHRGANMRVPRIYKFIIKYVTPLFLFIILLMWFKQEWLPIIFMKQVSIGDRAFILGTRIVLVLLFLVLAIMVKMAWRRKRLKLGFSSGMI